MPRTPRNSPNPTGRPAKDAEALAVAAEAERTATPVGEVAKRRGVGRSTVFAAKAKMAKRRAGKGAPAGRGASPRPSPASRPPSTSGGSPALAPGLPQGGASVPDGILDLVRRILDARNGAARVELDEGLVVATRGEGELAAWLARPIDAVALDGDELDVLREGLGFALGVARKSEAGGPQLRALGILDRLAKSTSVVAARRPREEGPDELTRRIVAVRDRAVDRIGTITGEVEAAFAVRRAEFATWAAGLGPVGAEVERRVGVVLGEQEKTA